MENKINILVTGVGSELAFSIIKALKSSKLKYQLFGCDICPEVVGTHWCDHFEQIPAVAEHSKYLDALVSLVSKKNIDILIPTVDPEFSVLASEKNRFENRFGCHILVNNAEEIKIFNDKWLAHKWFESNGIPTPETVLPEDPTDTFPCMIKPRQGGGSRFIFKAQTKEELNKFIPVVPDPIIQKYIAPTGGEFTAGTFRKTSGETHLIIMRRTLKFGMTNTAETVKDAKLETFCREVIQNTRLIGSNNIQFVVGSDGPMVHEINPRFSGTTGIRANFGFNDVEMWINEALGKKGTTTPSIKQGKVLRFMEELYVF